MGIPEHLATVQAMQMLRAHLNPQGAVLFNVIGVPENRMGSQFCSFVHTVRTAFRDVKVYYSDAPSELQNILLVAAGVRAAAPRTSRPRRCHKASARSRSAAGGLEPGDLDRRYGLHAFASLLRRAKHIPVSKRRNLPSQPPTPTSGCPLANAGELEVGWLDLPALAHHPSSSQEVVGTASVLETPLLTTDK